MELSTQVGDVESATTRWAIQCRGSVSTSSASSSSSAPVAAGPMTSPLPPEPSTRLKTSSSRRPNASLRTESSSRCMVSTFCRIGSSPR